MKPFTTNILNSMENKNQDVNKLSDAGEGADDSADKSSIDELQKELDKEKRTRKIERFYFIVGIIILFDSFWFPHMNGFSAIAILVLELILLVYLAETHDEKFVKSLVLKVIEGLLRR